MRKSIFIFTVIIFLSICVSVFIFLKSENPHFLSAFAQENEDDEEKKNDDGYERGQNDDDEEKKAKSEQIGKNQQNTISSLVIAETSLESTRAVSLAASSVTPEVTSEKRIFPRDIDGDGLYDDQDPHPGIHEKKIVRDDNRNGIVDAYE